MDLTEYRASAAELERTRDLLRLVPPKGSVALDIGARDGHFSRLLAERFDRVIALDLTLPEIDHPRVRCVQGNAAQLAFEDRSIDFVFCAEVLEHIPAAPMQAACREMERVCKDQILIGVPYRQDIRVGRTTCYSCMGKNPPWGHVNSFDEKRLFSLFPGSMPASISHIGTASDRTNALSCALMDLAGNPYGSYSQQEPCIHCGMQLTPPPERSLSKKVLTKLAFWARRATPARERANWIHVLFSKAAT
jgi:SAM-dependent methyltransferase